jgi:hypothetical protein
MAWRREQDQRQMPFGADDHDTEQDGLKNLCGDIGDDHHQFAETVGV